MKLAGKIFLPLSIVVIAALAMVFLLNLKKDSPKREIKIKPKLVLTDVVALDDIETQITGLGRAVSASPVDLYSEVAGILEPGEIDFKPAQSFKKGDLLLKVDDRQARLDLNSTKSDLLSALANLLPEIKSQFPDEYPIWQDYFNSIKFNRKLPEMPEPKHEKIKLYLANFNVYKLYFSALDQEITLDKHSLRAPFNGTIVSAATRPGTSVRNGTLLGEIISTDDFEIEVPVSLDDIRWIDNKKPAWLSSRQMTKDLSGNIVRIGSVINRETQTVPVYLTLNGNSGAIFDGSYLNAKLLGKTINDAYSIPRSAIYDDDYVYLLNNGKLRKAEINIARIEDEDAIINRGLNNNDTVVVETMQGVADGMSALSRNLKVEGEGL